MVLYLSVIVPLNSCLSTFWISVRKWIGTGWDKKSLFDTKDSVSKIKPIPDPVKLSWDKKDHLKPTKLIEVGTKARTVIQNGLVADEEVVKFCSYCCKCFVAAASYLQISLPFNNKILEYA